MQHYNYYNSQSVDTSKRVEAFIGQRARLSLVQVIASAVCSMLNYHLNQSWIIIQILI